MNETVTGSGLVDQAIDLDIKVVRDRWGWFMALGILMIVLGMIAIGGPFASGIAVSLLVGWLLVISGVAHGFHAFQASGWRGGLVQILCALLYLGVGLMMINNPISGLLALTVTVLVYFGVSGIFKIILAIRVEHLPQRGWLTVSGILSLVLAIYLGSQFPNNAMWVIGMLFGIEMIFSGWSFVMIAQAARKGFVGAPASGSDATTEAAA